MKERKEIKAAVLTSPGGNMEIKSLFRDKPRWGEVIVAVSATGICHSDFHYYTGSLETNTPIVLGHEVSGTIVEVGPGCFHRSVGEEVVVTISPSCGICPQCSAGKATLCTNTQKKREREVPKFVDAAGNEVFTFGGIGGFAEEIILKESAVVPVTERIDPKQSCLLGCCVITGFGAVTHAAEATSLNSAVVIGCGGVGISTIQSLRIAGLNKIVAIDMHQEKIDRAKTFGATHGIISSASVIDELERIVPAGVDYAFEAVGNPVTSALAFDLLAPNGTAVILGLQNSAAEINFNASKLIEGDRIIKGAYMGSSKPMIDIPKLVSLRNSGSLNLEDMITAVWSLAQINEGFEAIRDPNTIRGVVSFK